MYLWDEVIATADPVGIKLMGAPVDQSIRIDLSAGISTVVARLSDPDVFSRDEIDQLRDCFPPISGENLFVDFNAASSRYRGKNYVSRIGVHLVAWKDCSYLFLAFNELPPVDPSLYAEMFGLAFYIRLPAGLEYIPLGVRVGLDHAGCLALLDFFPLLPYDVSPRDRRSRNWRKQLPWYVYLVFATFAGINNETINLKALAKNVYATEANMSR